MAIVIWIIRQLYINPIHSIGISKVLRGLEIIGSNTLEIYFLHYFLLFPIPASVGNFLKMLSSSEKSLSFPEFLIVGTVVVVICVTCIFLSRLLKTIPCISLLAFGKSIKK